jgi:hypothetical protein
MATDRFVRPVLHDADTFQDTEVGLNHPTSQAYVRLKDNGDVEIVAGDGLAIVLHKQQRSITIVADSIRFLTKAQGGLRWNDKLFNERGDAFQEPTLVPAGEEDAFNLYKGVEHFIYDDPNEPTDQQRTLPAGIPQTPPGHPFPDVQVKDPETAADISYEQYYAKYGKPPPFGAS